MDVRGVQSHLIEELVELTEQVISAPLQGGRPHSQNLEAGTIHSLLVYNVGFYVAKEKYSGRTPLLRHLPTYA
jgi:hypothetical protein